MTPPPKEDLLIKNAKTTVKEEEAAPTYTQINNNA